MRQFMHSEPLFVNIALSHDQMVLHVGVAALLLLLMLLLHDGVVANATVDNEFFTCICAC
jgi:hypothetical protein